MKRFITCIAMLVVAASSVVAQGLPERAMPDPPPPAPVLAISPARESVPALKYDFRHNLLDTVPGNAAAAYNKAVLMLAQVDGADGKRANVADWLDNSLEELRVRRVVLDRYADALRQVTLGGKREDCKWDEPWREDNPFTSILMPRLTHFRELGRVLALKARLEIAEGKYDEACRTLRDGYLLTTRLADSRFLITVLVANAMTHMLNEQVEAMITAPNAPNLYWALSGLPRPAADLRKCLDLELNGVFLFVPELRDPEKELATAEQWRKAIVRSRRVTSLAGQDMEDLATHIKQAEQMVAASYPAARKHLLAKGGFLKAMSRHLVVAIYTADFCRALSDDAAKLNRVPFHAARPLLRQMEERVEAMAKEHKDSIVQLPLMLLPAVAQAAERVAATDRRIAALRCVEALRMHAAHNGNALPAKLDDVKIVPIPNDPMTGKPFEYSLQGGAAILKSPKLEGEREKDAVHYQITVRK